MYVFKSLPLSFRHIPTLAVALFAATVTIVTKEVALWQHLGVKEVLHLVEAGGFGAVIHKPAHTS